jgi:mono/diheme cytochrome c family protein
VVNPDAPAAEIEGVPSCGQPIFETYCGGCHGDDGRGRQGDTESGPDLAERVPDLSHQALFDVLEQGAEDMPASGLSAARQAHVAAWLRAEFP